MNSGRWAWWAAGLTGVLVLLRSGFLALARDNRPLAAVILGLRLPVLASAAASLPLLAACSSYTNYPAIDTPDDDAARNDANSRRASKVMATAMKRVVSTYPVEGLYVVNLPEGMTRDRAEDFMRRLDEPSARLLLTGSADVPVYHITRVWIRPSARAEVEILRPVFGVGNPGRPEQFQQVTVKLQKAAMDEWRVEAVRFWPIGLVTPPPLRGWSDTEAASGSSASTSAAPDAGEPRE